MNIVLLNEDNLSNFHPVFEKAKSFGDYKTIFIFDDKYLYQQNYSLKRIVFIYECLKEIKCDIFKGDILEVISDIGKNENPKSENIKLEKIFIPKTINPYFIEIYQELSKTYQIEIVDQNKFVELNKKPDLKRFFRYWDKAKKEIIRI